MPVVFVLNSPGQAIKSDASIKKEALPKSKPQSPAFYEARPTVRIVPRKVEYSGALVRFLRTDKRWQLINPLAPSRHGSGMNDFVADPVTGKAQGISLLSVRY